MDGLFNEIFYKSLETGFINKEIESELAFRPQLLTNKTIPKEKVLSILLQEFDTCDTFLISVAFVTTSGVAVLLNSLLALEKRNIKGKILVSQYLNFTQPEALKKLKVFKNIELRISTTNNTHCKGYIFRKKEHYNIIIGSSNLTSQALTVNKEWNLKVSGLGSSSIVNDLLSEFESDFQKASPVTDEFISAYQIEYEKGRMFNEQAKVEKQSLLEKEIVPNSMQLAALENLKQLRIANKNKALIISATGTGKTYLSAFDVKNFGSKRLLFVVHRLNIAQHALETFQQVFKNDRTFGIFSGDKKEIDKDFVFSTIQTIAKEENLQLFKKGLFDYIIIDESHRSGADSYRRLIQYFQPKFLLGMTATPERTDGNDIFTLFDHTIGYEIRLNKAMEEGMLSEFHYYGIVDLTINNEVLDDTRDFNRLEKEERVKKIIQNARFYGSDNGITRGLAFCSSNSEASFLSKRFNDFGFKTIALSGDSSEAHRNEAIAKLESNNNHERLDYIFTVDIFNEGVDIPRVNQILMIRPTNSAIIFVQQLGRGLRKAEGKDYLTVVDFIGNHKNNYLIPIALYGDTSYNKDTLRRLISEGSKMLPGSSTINFDEITKERIYESIDSANMRILSDLKNDYQLLKYRIGRIPMMMDFLHHELRDPFLFVEYAKSYYNFVKKVDPTYKITLEKKQADLLALFSLEINNAKRVEESFVLQALLANGEISVKDFRDQILDKYGYIPTRETIDSILSNLNFRFIRKNENILFLEVDTFKLHPDFVEILNNHVFRSFIIDSINYSLATFQKSYIKENYKEGLILYNKYSRKDVCRLLNWDNDVSSTVYGYKTKNGITPCFVTYHKSNEIIDSINYNDHFISPSVFAWESRSGRKVENLEIQNVIHSKRILLFVKKEDAEGTDFYYMGDVSIIKNSVEQAKMPQSGKSVVHFKFKLEKPVPENLYKYITEVYSKKAESADTNQGNKLLELTSSPSGFTIPFYDLYAAAGSFSELQSTNTYSQIEVDEKYGNSDDYFALKVVGESMNRRIPNQSICIFKKYHGGSRNGKIVLVEYRDIQDPDFKAAFTVKTYSSQKSIKEDVWGHDEIVLKPNSFDKRYTDIILDPEQAEGMKIIGEFVTVLDK